MAKKERCTQDQSALPSPTNLPSPTKPSLEDGDTCDLYDFSYTQNREVSWLKFDNRVLDEALDTKVPLYERLKFVSIFSSNLDEWFMVRIGGLTDLTLLKHQPRDNKSNETPTEQIATVLNMLNPLLQKKEQTFLQIEEKLAALGVVRVMRQDLTDQDLATIAKFYENSLLPFISPTIVDPRHPFPNLRGQALYIACSLDGPEEKGVLGLVEVPNGAPRLCILPSGTGELRYLLVEDVLMCCLDECFGAYKPHAASVIRVTRNADIDPDGEGVEEEEDYRAHMKKVLKRRQRLQPIRLELAGDLPKNLVSFIAKSLALSPVRVFQERMPLDLSYVFGLGDLLPQGLSAQLKNKPVEPQESPLVDPAQPLRPQIEDHDVLLCYPYDSMKPLLNLLKEASNDDTCIQIKITLYRVAKQSRLCESLIAAAENGKEVTVLMELRARFDEANNIAWAERLEHAGCTVLYGSEGFKVHSKICQITYHDAGKIVRLTCLGTGNFNESTARLYSDFMLMTAHPGIGEDGNTFFRNMSLGNLQGNYTYLGVAPKGLKPLVMKGIDREIERARAGLDAQIFMKMNSLTDRDVIDRLAAACQAGVRCILIVRGICCIKANIPGKTDGLIVRQIVGRFLEHARIYAFGALLDTIYLSSADMMTRNTEHRVEIAYPILDKNCRQSIVNFVNIQLADNVKARELDSDGTWQKITCNANAPKLDSQMLLMALAYLRANRKSQKSSTHLPQTITLNLSEAQDAQLATILQDFEQSLSMLTLTSAGTASGSLHLPHKAKSEPRLLVVQKKQHSQNNEPNESHVANNPKHQSRTAHAFMLIGLGLKELVGGWRTRS